MLQDAGIRLSSVASTSYSKSARAMREALLSGVSDPDQLAELSNGKMRAKIPQLREALQSRFTIEHHGVVVAQLLAHIDTLDAAPQNLTARIELVLAPHAHLIALLSRSRRPSASRPSPDRRVRPEHERVPHGRALRVLGTTRHERPLLKHARQPRDSQVSHRSLQQPRRCGGGCRVQEADAWEP